MEQVRAVKYLFLDMDGVVNSNGYLIKSDDPWVSMVDPLNVAQINVILEAIPELLVVLSSAWRLYPGKDVTLEALRKAGYKGDIFDVTPKESSRGEDIYAYIFHHDIEEDDICILDDDTDIHPLRHRWVRTFDFEGLTPKGAAQAIDMLKGKL